MSSSEEHILVSRVENEGIKYVSRISPARISILDKLDDKYIVGYCNGLWCLRLYGIQNCKFGIANPTTFELKYLPSFGIENSSCGESYCRSRKCSLKLDYPSSGCALGFDSRNGDLKLFVLVSTRYYDLEHQYEDDDEDKDPDASLHCISSKIFIYSLKTDTWKECKKLACPWERELLEAERVISFGSACYWALDEHIGLFNFCDEKFSCMPYPSDILDRPTEDYVIIDLLGSLGVVTYPSFGGARFFRFWIWEDDHGWKRKPDYDVFLFGVRKPLGVSHSWCWFVGLNYMLVRYDYTTKETKTLYEFFDDYMTLYPHVVNNLNINGTGVICDVFNKLNISQARP